MKEPSNIDNVIANIPEGEKYFVTKIAKLAGCTKQAVFNQIKRGTISKEAKIEYFKGQIVISKNKTMKHSIKIISATYLEGYKISLLFCDGKTSVFDFESLVNSNMPDCVQFKDIEKFKGFYLDNGDLVFNDNWDMSLPIATLYRKSSIVKAGRPKTTTGKTLVRVWMPDAIVSLHGGVKPLSKYIEQKFSKNMLNNI